jgi:ribosomal protein S21
MINVAVEKNHNENNANLMRRFTKRMQSAGIVNKVRGERYYERALSDGAKKRKALKTLDRKEKYNTLFKLGKLPEKTKAGHRR